MNRATIGRAILVAAASLAVWGCGSSSEPLSFTIKPEGTFVPGVNHIVELDVDVSGPDRDGRIVVAAGQAVAKVGKDMTEGKPPVSGDFDHVVFTIRAPGAPVSDDSVAHKIMHLSFDAQELRRAVHAGVSDDTLLSFASEAGWWTPSNDDVIEDYCSKHQQSAFCGRFNAE